MYSNRKDNMFALLHQDGPFATRDIPPGRNIFSIDTRNRINLLRSEEMITKYRVLRNQTFDFLDVSSAEEIEKLIHNREKRLEVNRRAYKLLGNMFGINGNEREIVSRVDNYSRTADGVIRYLRNKVLANYASHIEITNEIDVARSPVDLLLTTYDNRYHKKARFT